VRLSTHAPTDDFGQNPVVLDIDDRNDGRVRVLTLDRPDALNAFNTTLYNAGADALRAASADNNVRCVVVTGRGRAFSAGQDLGEMSRIDTDAPSDEPHGFPNFLAALSTFDKPLIAAVNGLGVGIGLTMLLHSDIVIMAHSARLRAPFTPLGVAPEAASSYLMPVVMGNQAASYFLYTGNWISASEAVACGIAWKSVPDEELLTEAFAAADEIGRMPTVSLVATKRLVVAGRIDAINAARAREDDAFSRLIGGPANIEAIQAFLEKRDPVF
jgi:enoyl-CoA hydratase/carnithine racemase